MADEEVDDAQLQDELRELQEMLGISYRSTTQSRRVSTTAGAAGKHSALAQEWEDLDSLLEETAADKDAAEARGSGAAPDAAAEQGTAAEGSRVQVISTALAKNRELQKRLKAGLASLDRASHRLADLRSAVLDLKIKYKGTKPGTVQPQATCESRFWSAAGRHPEPNADTPRLLGAYQYLPHTFGSSAWSAAETAALAQAVLTTTQEVMLHEQLEQGADTSHEDLSRVSEKLKALSHDSPEVREAAAALDARQWAKVAQLAGGKRSAFDCRCHWAAALAANREPWSAEERARMEEIAKEHAFRNWPAIAEELGTGRHASECLAQWRRGTLAAAPATKWDSDEDTLLHEAVKRHGRNWQAIASEVGGGRTAANCLQRWTRRGAGVALKRGKWAKEEDQALLQAVSTEGRKWSLVAQHVAGRSDVQCRERFMNTLDPTLRGDPWDEAEDQQLREAVKRNTKPVGGTSWVSVAADLPGRTNNAVARRWKHLQRGPRKRRKDARRDEEGDANAGQPAAKRTGRPPSANKQPKGMLKRKTASGSEADNDSE